MLTNWHRLSGYLWYKQGGTLGKLKARRRLWYLFDESHCQLLAFKSEEDARTSKDCVSRIDLQFAAISLSLSDENMFIIMSDGKEIFLSADNHESMMIWLSGLQSVRDFFSREVVAKEDNGRELWNLARSVSNPLENRLRNIVERTMNERRMSLQNSASSASADDESLQYDRLRLQRRLADTHDQTCDERSSGHVHSTFRKLSKTGSTGSTVSTGSCEDVFQEHETPRRWHGVDGSAMAGSLTADRPENGDWKRRISELEQELIDAKKEVAELKNSEVSYKEEMERNESWGVIDPDDEANSSPPFEFYSSDEKTKQPVELQVLQQQHKFLNEEVRKLNQQQTYHKQFIDKQNRHITEMLVEIEQWKRDYVSLIQSSVHVPSGDVVDGMELDLFSANKHKSRILSLLNEARASNPALPTYSRLAQCGLHVDQHGFKHAHQNEGLLLHYVCSQLDLHYDVQLDSFQVRSARWRQILAQTATPLLEKTKEVKILCRSGVPANLRSEVWCRLIHAQVAELKQQKGKHYFQNISNNLHESEIVGKYRKQISLDLLRTMPTNIKFATLNDDGTRKLQKVLQSFCVHNPIVGYCQGMNFLAAVCLLFLDTENAFWALVAVTEKYFASNYFDQLLSGAQADQEVLKELLKEKLPKLDKHFASLDIDISTVTLNWFLAVFFDALPFETLLRVWDCFLYEGPKVLFRFALALLRVHENDLLQRRDTISIIKHIKSCARLTFDADGFVKVAFEDMNPFASRQEIAAKQVVYLNTLKEKLRRRDRLRKQVTEDHLDEVPLADSKSFTFECAVTAQQGQIWVGFGTQNCGRLCLVNCMEGLIYDLSFEHDSRILCMCYVSPDVVLVGTLSWHLHAYCTLDRKQLWSLHLHDSVLAVCTFSRDVGRSKVFAALADGTIAVLENVGKNEPHDDVIYINIGRYPVTSLAVIEKYLWCGCGHNIHILCAETLDCLEKASVSHNSFDHIQALVSTSAGVWIAVKGSSTLELWDFATLECKMLFDVRTNEYPATRKDEDGCLNKSRITSLLPNDDSLWIGTGDGNLIIYDIITKYDVQAALQQRRSSASKPGVGPAEGLPAGSKGKKVGVPKRGGEMLALPERRPLAQNHESRAKNASADNLRNARDIADSRLKSTKRTTSTEAVRRSQSFNVEDVRPTVEKRSTKRLTTRNASRTEERARELSAEEKKKNPEHFITSSKKSAEKSEREQLSSIVELPDKTASQSEEEGCRPWEKPIHNAYVLTVDTANTSSGNETSSPVNDPESLINHAPSSVLLKGTSKDKKEWTARKGSCKPPDKLLMPPDDGDSSDGSTPTPGEKTFVIPAASNEAPSHNKEKLTDTSKGKSSYQCVAQSVAVAISPVMSQTKSSLPLNAISTSSGHNACIVGKDKDNECQLAANPTNTQDSNAEVKQKSQSAESRKQGQEFLDEGGEQAGNDGLKQVNKLINKSELNKQGKRPESKLEKGPEVRKMEKRPDKQEKRPDINRQEKRPAINRQEKRLDINRQEKRSEVNKQEMKRPDINKQEKRLEIKKQDTNKQEHEIIKQDMKSSDKQEKKLDANKQDRRMEVNRQEKKTKAQIQEGKTEKKMEISMQGRKPTYRKEVRQAEINKQDKKQGPQQILGGKVVSIGKIQESNEQIEDSTCAVGKENILQGAIVLEGAKAEANKLELDNSIEVMKCDNKLQVSNTTSKSESKAIDSKLEANNFKLKPDGDKNFSEVAKKNRLIVNENSSFEDLSDECVQSSQTNGEKCTVSEGKPAALAATATTSTVTVTTSGPAQAEVVASQKSVPGTGSAQSPAQNPAQNKNTLVLPVSSSSVRRSSLPQRNRFGHFSSGETTGMLSSGLQVRHEMNLDAKVKVADKPIKCLVHSSLQGQPIIISLAGCYGDDEAVLKWRREPDEALWTNEPILEVCPRTNEPRTPNYMKNFASARLIKRNAENRGAQNMFTLTSTRSQEQQHSSSPETDSFTEKFLIRNVFLRALAKQKASNSQTSDEVGDRPDYIMSQSVPDDCLFTE